jgi:hypothetical protein
MTSRIRIVLLLLQLIAIALGIWAGVVVWHAVS